MEQQTRVGKNEASNFDGFARVFRADGNGSGGSGAARRLRSYSQNERADHRRAGARTDA